MFIFEQFVQVLIFLFVIGVIIVLNKLSSDPSQLQYNQ